MSRGKVRTSAILVASGQKTAMYRTLQEMPFSLRRKLVRLASGPNTGTLLIADQRGVDEWLSSQGRVAPAPSARRRPRWIARRWLARACWPFCCGRWR